MTTALLRALRQHWLLALLVLAGAALRIVVYLAYRPALLYIDSFRYLSDVGVFYPGGINPVGYEYFILPLLWIGGLSAVAATQALLGVGLGVGIYVLLRRFGVRRWLAALASAPVLLDAYQLQIEANIMSDLLFQVLLLTAIYLLCFWGTPGPRLAGWAGAVLAFGVITRSVGVTLVVPVAVFVLLAAGLRPRDGWRSRLVATGALVGVFASGVLAYATFSAFAAGRFGIGGSTGGGVLYGRAAVVADCENLGLTPEEYMLCPHDDPPAKRQELGIDHYLHYYDVSWTRDDLPEDLDIAAAQRGMTNKVLDHQPWDIARGIVRDFFKGFAPTRTQSVGDVPLDRWHFQLDYPLYNDKWFTDEWAEIYDGGPVAVRTELASFLRTYQLNGGYTPGIVLGFGLLLATVALIGVGRAVRSGLRAVILLPTGMIMALLSTAAAMEFSWRYQLPGLVLIPIAAALAATAIFGRRAPVLPRPLDTTAQFLKESRMLTTFPDEVDRRALDDYASRYGEHQFAPVVVLIAAYNEEESIGEVLDSIPARSSGLDVDKLVVVDGAKDDSAGQSLKHGAYTCVAPSNRGQGAALRLGYRLAAERGARYVITTDADGQYDINELSLLLQPLVEGRADFVSGSRVLGVNERPALVRRLGTYVFAWIVSALTGQRITDTSFGFRGMRVGVPNAVTLQQPQYQSSELLVGVLSHGYRVLEQPMRMLPRVAGESKKGGSIAYGYRYAKVVLGTWWRERRGRREAVVVEPAAEVSEPAAAAGDR